MNIIELIGQGESSTLEFKSTIENPAKIAKTLVAFANTGGGILLIGVTDDKKICGIKSEVEIIGLLEEASDMYCHPPILIRYELIRTDGKEILAVTIPESEDKPHLLKEKDGEETVYVRMHDKSVPTGKLTARNLGSYGNGADKTLMQSGNVKNLLKYLFSNEYITAKRYAKLINISERRATRLLMELSSQQIVLPVERDKDVVYTLSSRNLSGKV
ncbi:ATP-binding protein [Cytophagaceae bacterium DM2B3-1]|uniref:ATP-binding protein n=1 Tax=Xanthocytophaga flava TaxID=3048013 RepID=A0ABT7CDC7_9BACT|nr:ATP-binding protein [Xanthocytophaga flavus]MDJ1491730.1 ATP-binding protein [Xanthocytophaga flavus]